MKKLKKEIRWFSIMEYEKEENYLSKRHLEGWKFKSVTFPGLYTFERCEPEKIIYQLDYNKEGIKHQSEYVRMFEDCGWEYLTEFDGYNYFRKPADKMQQKEEIFCDDISRLDMMNRIFRGRVIPLILMILCILIDTIVTHPSEPDWVPLQKKIYEDAHGKIKPGQMICFLDCNHQNFDIDNLYCIDRRIAIRMAQNGWWSSNRDITLAGIKCIELQIALKNQ